MGIYDRARRSAFTAICACSLVSGIGMVTVPEAALAVKCAKTTGSGSSLQAKQQEKWQAVKLAACMPETPITYTATSSGQGLKEFGIPGSKLVPAEAGNKTTLDAFIGTDDPPTAAQLTEAKTASGSAAETAPIVAAPIAIILHPAKANCVIIGNLSKEFVIPNKVLNELWLSKFPKWRDFLKAAKIKFEKEEVAAKQCEEAIKLEVRSDSSGTSFAFKQYLSQIEAAPWTGFVTDESKWPNEPGEINRKHKTGENKGSSNEAIAVAEEENAIGYVNLANAATAFAKWAPGKEKFWAQVQNRAGEEEGAEPEAAGVKGNCPKELTAAQKAELPETLGKVNNPPDWSKFHLATQKPKDKTYPLCTLTYDVSWEKFNTANLIAQYGGKGGVKAEEEKITEEVANSTQQYFKYMTEKLKGQANIENYYTELPGEVQKLAQETAEKVKF